MTSELILVVDDNPDIRMLVRACLEAEGFKVVEAEDGLQALVQSGIGTTAFAAA